MVDGPAALCWPRSHNLRIACVFHWEVVFDLNPFCCTGLEPQCAGVRNSIVQQCVSDTATMLSASLGAAQLLGVGQSGPCLRVLRTNSSRFFPQISEGCVQLYRRAVMTGLPGHRRPWSSIAAGHTNAGAQSALFASMPAALAKPVLRLQLSFGFKGLCIVVVLVWLGATR